MTLAGLSEQAITARLRAAGCVYAEEEARLLRAEAFTPAQLRDRVAARERGMPLEYLLGWAEFAGVRIAVQPGVFVPRRRTEFLAAQAIARAPARGVAVDLCCGSGNIAVTLGRALPDLEVYACDIDPTAVACARGNLAGRATVLLGDLFDALPRRLRGLVDVLVVNAPYVPTDEITLMPAEARIHESRVALDGGHDGLDLQRRVAAGAADWLTPGGYLLLETSRLQATRSRRMVAAGGLHARVYHDPENAGTIVAAELGRPRVPVQVPVRPVSR